MAVVTCPVCRARLNSEATKCPECGADPRLSVEEARAQLRANQASQQADREMRIEEADGLERLQLLRLDPVSLGRWARKAGLRTLQVEVTEEKLAESLASALGESSAEVGGEALRVFFLDAMEVDGWCLESMQAVYRPTGVISIGGSIGGAIGAAVNKIEGELLYVYLFRRSH